MRKIGVALAVALALPFGAAAQDLARGKLLYETQCNQCHDERLHDRPQSAVKDMAQLRDAVWRWSQKTKQRRFSIEELDDIAAYLNASHYRFGGEGTRKP